MPRWSAALDRTSFWCLLGVLLWVGSVYGMKAIYKFFQMLLKGSRSCDLVAQQALCGFLAELVK